MKQLWRLLTLLALTLLILSIVGCSIGVKRHDRIIYAGFAKSPEELHGAVRIATNKPIPVTIVGEGVTSTYMDLGGMLAVREADLAMLIRMANEKANEKANETN